MFNILFFCFLQNSRTRNSFSNKFITFLHKNLKKSSRTGGGGEKGTHGYYQTGQRDTNLRLDLFDQKVDFTGKNVILQNKFKETNKFGTVFVPSKLDQIWMLKFTIHTVHSQENINILQQLLNLLKN